MLFYIKNETLQKKKFGAHMQSQGCFCLFVLQCYNNVPLHIGKQYTVLNKMFRNQSTSHVDWLTIVASYECHTPTAVFINSIS